MNSFPGRIFLLANLQIADFSMNNIQLKNRQHQRHQCCGTLVVTSTCVCQVLDLSEGGISFGCTSEKQFSKTWAADIINGSGVHIYDLPVKVVWVKENNSTSSIHIVKVGAKFQKNLTLEQKAALNELLDSLKEMKP